MTTSSDTVALTAFLDAVRAGRWEQARRQYIDIKSFAAPEPGLPGDFPTLDYLPLSLTPSLPRISLVTPSWNSGDFLEETIASVRGQNYPGLEWIFLDNMSDDATPAILAHHVEAFTHLICARDNGQSDALNTGFALATGDIVSWLNADDMLFPQALHHIADSWRHDPWDVGIGGCFLVENGHILNHAAPSQAARLFDWSILTDLDRYFRQGHFFYQPEIFFSRRMLERAGFGVDASLHFTMDHELWLRVAALKPKVAAIPWPLVCFRRHEKQKTADADAGHAELLRLLRPLAHQEKDRTRHEAVAAYAALKQRHDHGFVFVNGEGLPTVAGSTGSGGASRPTLQVVDDPYMPLPPQQNAESLRCAWLRHGHKDIRGHYLAAQAFDLRFFSSSEFFALLGDPLTDAVLPPCIDWMPAADLDRLAVEALAAKREDVVLILSGPNSSGSALWAAALVEKGIVTQELEFTPDHFMPPKTLFAMTRALIEHKVALVPKGMKSPELTLAALAAGMAAVIPEDMPCLELLLPKEIRRSLGCQTFTSAEDAADAIQRAATAFASTGLVGQSRRLRHVRDNHLLANRVAAICGHLASVSADWRRRGSAKSREARVAHGADAKRTGCETIPYARPRQAVHR